MISRTSMKSQMKGNKMPIKLVPLNQNNKDDQKMRVLKKKPAKKKELRAKSGGSIKKMKKGGKTQKQLDQGAKFRASKAYQSKNKKKTGLKDLIKNPIKSIKKDLSDTTKINRRAAQVAIGDPIAEKKYGTGKRTGFDKYDAYFPSGTDGSVEKPLKSYKRDKNSPNKSGFRVTKKKSGGVIKAGMGKLLETFSPAYSMMKGKGPIAEMLGMAKAKPMKAALTKEEREAQAQQQIMANKSGSSNRMTPMTGMMGGGSVKKKRSIDGIATKGRTRG